MDTSAVAPVAGSGHRIPSLDGLRAVSIGLVIIAHSAEFLPPTMPARGLAGYGAIAVSIFFVISGYLITTLLIDEQTIRGRIDLRNFYIRRIVRIMPAYYVFLAVMLALAAFGLVALTGTDFVASALFVRDYKIGATSYLLGHTWTLSVEEQFYLLWPCAVLLLGRKSLVFVCLAILALCPVLRLATYFIAPNLRDAIDTMFHTRADTLVFGCLLALLMRSTWRSAVPAWLTSWPAAAVACGFLLGLSPMLRWRFGGFYLFPVGQTLEGLAIVMLVQWLISQPRSLPARILNSAPFVAVGVMSYSLYLWQQIFLAPHFTGMLRFYPLNLALAVAAAAASYLLLERPLMAIRRRLHRRRIASTQMNQQRA